MDNTKLFDAVGALYDCVAEPDRWPSALGRINELTDSVIAMLAVMDVSRKTARFSAVHGNPAVLEPLVTTYAAHVPFYSILPKFEIDVPLDFDELCNLYGPDGYDVWYASRTYTDWMRPNRFRTGFNLAVMKRDEYVGALTTITRDDTPSSPANMARLSQLAPHIRRAVTITDLFEAEQRKAGIFREVIDNLSHPVLIVTSDMRLLYANTSAEVLLRDETLIRQAEGRLAIAYAPAQASGRARSGGRASRRGPARRRRHRRTARQDRAAFHPARAAVGPPSECRLVALGDGGDFHSRSRNQSRPGTRGDLSPVRPHRGGEASRRTRSRRQDPQRNRPGERCVRTYRQNPARRRLRQDRHPRPAAVAAPGA
jgi:PAS domain-containing protein